jgi:hypothetical protein
MFTFTVGAGFVLGPTETVTNAKLNLMGVPIVTPAGGLEWVQTRIDSYFYGTNGGLVNAYTLQLTDAKQNRTAPLSDGTVLSFKPGVTNTAASTLLLKDSTGATILAAKAIRKRFNVALAAGDLVAGQIYEIRYDAINDIWQLVSPWGGIASGSDLAPDQYFYCGASGSATAFTLTATPAPTAHKAGMHIFFGAPATNTNNTLTINLNGLGALSVKKRDGQPVVAGDLVSGAIYHAVLEPSAGYWVVLNPSTTSAKTVVGTSSNLVGSRTSVTTVRIQADQVLLQNSTTLHTHLASAVDVSPVLNGASTGANALDTGTEAASTWYYVYVIYNSTTNTVAGLLSISATAPTLPSGYDFKALVGVVRNDGSSNLIDFTQSGRVVWCAPQTIFTAKSSAVANTYEVVTGAEQILFQAAVPPIAKMYMGLAGGQEASGATYISVAADATGMGAATVVGAFGTAMDTFTCVAPIRVPLKASQVTYFKTGNTTNDHRLDVTGFEF